MVGQLFGREKMYKIVLYTLIVISVTGCSSSLIQCHDEYGGGVGIRDGVEVELDTYLVEKPCIWEKEWWKPFRP
jgi:hypothetical protein